MQLIVIVEGGDQVHSLEVPYDADLLTVMQLIQSEVNILYSCGVVVVVANCINNSDQYKIQSPVLCFRAVVIISLYRNLHVLCFI